VLFQTLDDKRQCHGIYQAGKFYYGSFPEKISKSWNYTPYLKGKQVDYAFLFTMGKALDEVCPEHLKEDWQRVGQKMKAFVRSFAEAKISLDHVCFYDLVPQNFLIELCELKNRICEHVFLQYERPDNYDFLLETSQLLGEISHQRVNCDLHYLRSNRHDPKVRGWLKRIERSKPYVEYDLFGTKTGRLSTKKRSFPIMTLPRLYRQCVKPENDWFLELDFNAAELRTILALSGFEQPQEDLHAWNAKNIYASKYSRQDTKRKIISWLYNPSAVHYTAGRYYNRDLIREKYWDGTQVVTPFGRTIEADYDHALNYVIQSTTSDLTLKQAIKLNKLLEDKKTKIAFCLHDSVILDVSYNDRSMIEELAQIFSETELGKYFVNVAAGKDFGRMRTINI
jgi:hypothetical protein